MSSIHYADCPVCKSRQIDPLMTIRDHSVSKENFVIWQCRNCTLRFTQDAPEENEIGRYYQSQEYISHTNTQKGLLNKIYQRVRKITLKQKADFIIKQTQETGSLLDVGAGIGAFASVMKQRGWRVTGVEPDPGARQQSEKLFGERLIPSMEDGNLRNSSFDAISLWHVMEHVHALHEYVEKLKGLLKPEGKLFIAVPNYTAMDADIYKTWWAAYDVPRHLYHFSPLSMQKLLELHGLKLQSTHRMMFDSYYISLLSSKYKKGKPSWIGAGLSGLRSNANALLNKDRCSSLLYVVSKF
jgi:2-polyprenyl-3-methyl-5-hydroxy-6-metoxy-1,4-benzoquinol methylase